jgi:hypothetical protein
MNPNDVLAQYQAMLNQATQQSQKMMWVAIAFQVVVVILTAWAIYMFYARLRDIVDELRKFRMAYESSGESNLKAGPNRRESPAPDDDSPYMPKR